MASATRLPNPMQVCEESDASATHSPGWGGPESLDKREWFASSTIDIIAENPDADAEWIEEFLLDVMMNEFEVNVEDDSALEVADKIVRLRKDCMRGEWAEVLLMKEKWEAKGRGGLNEVSAFLKCEDEDAETSESESESDKNGIEEDRMDVDVDVAPAHVRVKEPVMVDEDGFTTVTKKKR